MRQNKLKFLISIRFWLIFYIVQGHFIQVATSNKIILQIFKQHNMVVGCFFLLSGFVLALGGSKKKQKIKFKSFFKKRFLRIYPSYILILLLFMPMFLAIDFYYGATIWLEIKRAFITITLIQAWHPSWGLLWNSPTWFLSSLAFCYLIFPTIFNRIADFSNKKLWMLGALLFSVLLVIKIIYCYYNQIFFLEGMLPAHKINFFNWLRFFPPINALEFLLGVIVGTIFSKVRSTSSKATEYAPVLLMLAIVLLMIVRLIFPINDMLFRTVFLTPLFLMFLYFGAFGNSKGLGILQNKFMIHLGNISFALYCLHGALGQLFYKKAVKTMLALPHIPYWFYLVSLIVLANIFYWLENKVVRKFLG
jgi:peptidoglycan/LPS O-acetylase OafA/YrhL